MRTNFCSVRLQIDKELPFASEMPDVLFDVGGLHDATQETLWVMPYDSVMQVRSIVEVARGGYHNMEIPIPAVLTAVLAAGVDRFAIAHNHSTGDVAPTEPDMDLTRKIMAAANACGLYFEDHLILGPNGESFSMADEGILIPAPQLKAMAKTNRKVA